MNRRSRLTTAIVAGAMLALLLPATRAAAQVERACCVGGQCFITTEQLCLAKGGVWFPDMPLCTPLLCPGGCCLNDLCVNGLDENGCNASGGTFLGIGNPCLHPDHCTLPGACCVFGGCQVTTVTSCINAGGEWQGINSDCVPGGCGETGACCFVDGSCEQHPPSVCAALGGEFQGFDEPCSPVLCDELPGACCLPGGACAQLTEGQCNSADGEFGGNGTPCEAGTCAGCAADLDGDGNVGVNDLVTLILDWGDCPAGLNPGGGSGLCCAAGTCQVIPEDECEALGGDWQGPGFCGPGFCPTDTGACCLPDGGCLATVNASECGGLGGDFHGVGAFCNEVDCDGGNDPNGLCCAGGTCTVIPQSECEALGGEHTPQALCGPGFCPTDTGACCLPGGGCTATVNESGCAAAGGTFSGVGTFCNGVSCADCPSDLDGDGQVGVNDLVTLILQWGSCP